MLVWSWWFVAQAAGPWVPGAGRTSVYLGVEGQRFNRVAAYSDDGVDNVRVGEGINTLTAVGVVQHGLGTRAALELVVPFHHGHASRPDVQLCADLGLDACRETNVVGVIEAEVKGLVLDELSGAPFSLAAVGEVRFGALAAKARSRLTGPGVGTMDLGVIGAIGRSGALGARGYYSLSLDLGWRYRVPHTTTYPLLNGDEVVPASEFHGDLQALFAPVPSVALGPSVLTLIRPWGRDFGAIEPTDIDRFSSLRVGDIRVGAKVILKDPAGNAFVLSVHRTVWAWNNPSDTLSVGAGVNLVNPFKRSP